MVLELLRDHHPHGSLGWVVMLSAILFSTGSQKLKQAQEPLREEETWENFQPP